MFFLMLRPPPIATLTVTLFPSTTLFRSGRAGASTRAAGRAGAGEGRGKRRISGSGASVHATTTAPDAMRPARGVHILAVRGGRPLASARSEEHTSELQSLMRISYAVFCLKKKTSITNTEHHHKPNDPIPQHTNNHERTHD